ncbi:MAG: plasmid mobilization relaxosome protein MobC [Lachnospiraceae bacterium]|nr:plasmid mobilization relaxosome protein MobC [Lachnospiraceae bacterium]
MASNDSIIHIRVTKDEWDKIHKRMEQSGISNMSAFIRKMALDGYLIKLDLADVKEVLRLLRINSNNLNQYAKVANTTGNIYLTDIIKLREQHKRLLENMGIILDRLSCIS